jgi:hypothetical protein
MGVAKAHQVHHALHRAVLARRAVQGVEHNVRLRFGQAGGDVLAHVDAGHAVAEAFQRIGDARAAHQRHVPLGRPAAHQDGDMKRRDHQ